MVDNVTSQHLYIEKYSTQTISVNNTVNQSGVIVKDNNNNALSNANVTLGVTRLGKLINYNYPKKLLVYNGFGEYGLYSNNDEIGIRVDWINGVNYRINAEIITSTQFNVNTFNINLTGKTIYKVMLNKKDISSFTNTNNSLTLTGKSTLMKDILYNELEVVCYDNTQTITNQFQIEYDGVIEIYNVDNFLNVDYFYNKDYMAEILSYETLNYTEQVEVAESSRLEFGRGKKIITNDKGTITMNVFIDEDTPNILKLIRNKFRIIKVNPYMEKIVIYNNCYIEGGVNEDDSKEKNTKSLTIDCDRRIEIYNRGSDILS